MITIIKQDNPWKPHIGDVLSGGEYIKCLLHSPGLPDLLEFKVIGLKWIANHGWVALEKLGIAITPAIAFSYECPFVDGNHHYHFLPHFVLVNDLEVYKEHSSDWPDMVLDRDWLVKYHLHSNLVLAEAQIQPSPIDLTIRGHGYTSMTIPSDGHGKWALACLELSNGDLVVGWLWIWYNK